MNPDFFDDSSAGRGANFEPSCPITDAELEEPQEAETPATLRVANGQYFDAEYFED